MFDFIVTNRNLIEGILLTIAGFGFLIFDIGRVMGNESEDFKPIKHTKGLVFVGIMFLILGTISLFFYEDFIYGINYVIAGISLIIYIIAWGKDFRILTIITTLFIFFIFLGFGIFSIINIGITITNVSFIVFGIGLAVFQIGAQTDKDNIILSGGIPLLLGTILLGGIFVVEGFTNIGNFVSNFFPVFSFNLHRSLIEAISYIVSGLGIVGLTIGIGFGANSGPKKDRNIIAGIFLIILGIGFAGLAFVDTFFSDKAHQRVMFAVFSLSLLFGTVCSMNLIMFGKGILKNDFKIAGNNMVGVFLGFIGLFIEWFATREYLFGIGAILFIISWVLYLIISKKNYIINLLIILFFVLC